MLQPSIYRLRLQDILTICVLGLLCLGILMVQSAAMNITEQTTWHWTDRGAGCVENSGDAHHQAELAHTQHLDRDHRHQHRQRAQRESRRQNIDAEQDAMRSAEQRQDPAEKPNGQCH